MDHREKKDLYCVDWEQTKLGLWGSAASGTYSNIDIMAVPCHMGQAFWADDNYTEPPDDCEWDKDKAISYMKNLHFSLVYNKISFR